MVEAPRSARRRISFNGPQSLANSKTFWRLLALGIAVLLAYPQFAAPYDVNNAAFLGLWAFLALSVSLLWGFTGVFSFGQTTFFGLAGYAYGVFAINLAPLTGETVLAATLAIAIAALFALLIGYIMFFGGVSALYVAIFTLMLTLLGETVANRTSGVTLGGAALGGSNGMVGIPPLQLSVGLWFVELSGASFYYLVLALLVIVYLALRSLLNSSFGYAMVSTREDPLRTEMLGYDVRLIYLTVFVLAGALAGLSGVLFASWNYFFAPSSMGLTAATLPVIWVAAGGRKSLLAVILATIVLQWINQKLAYSGSEYSLLFFAALILGIVMVLPEGAIPALTRLARRATARHV